MNTYYAAYWSDISYSSSEEEDQNRYRYSVCQNQRRKHLVLACLQTKRRLNLSSYAQLRFLCLYFNNKKSSSCNDVR